MDDYYRLLDLAPTASSEEIREQYRFLCHAYHPDKFPAGKYKLIAEERFKQINIAYQTLSDPDKRADYDLRRTRAYATADPVTTTRARPARKAPHKGQAKPGDRCFVCDKPAIGATVCCGAPYCRECAQESLKIAAKGRLMFECFSCFQPVHVGLALNDDVGAYADVDAYDDCELCGNRAIGTTPCCEEARCRPCAMENIKVTRSGRVWFECSSCEEITDIGSTLHVFADK